MKVLALKKSFWIALWMTVAVALSYTASEAALAPGTPGCNDGNASAGLPGAPVGGDQPSSDPTNYAGGNTPGGGDPALGNPSNTAGAPEGGFMGVLEDQANTYRVRNHAIVSEKMRKSSTTLGLTCFDKAMALTSRLGSLFSDSFPVKPGTENLAIFGGGISLYGTESDNPMGIKDKLGSGLAAIINGGDIGSGDGTGGILSQFMGGGSAGTNNNFAGSLSGDMGYTVATALNDLLSSVSAAVGNITAMVTGALGQISSLIGQLGGVVNQVQGAFDTVSSYLNSGAVNYATQFLGNSSTSFLTDLMGIFQTIQGVVDGVATAVATASSFVTTASGFFTGALNNYLDIAGSYIQQVQGAATSMAGLSAFNAGIFGSFPGGGFNFQSANFSSVGTQLFNSLGIVPPHIETSFNWDSVNKRVSEITGTGCNGLNDMWGGLKSAGTQWVVTNGIPELEGGLAGLFGSGPTTIKDLPFFSLDEMVGGTVSGGDNLLAQIAGGALSGSDEIIQAALDNLNNVFVAPGGPSGLTSWRKPQILPGSVNLQNPSASVDEVICLMRTPQGPC